MIPQMQYSIANSNLSEKIPKIVNDEEQNLAHFWDLGRLTAKAVSIENMNKMYKKFNFSFSGVFCQN